VLPRLEIAYDPFRPIRVPKDFAVPPGQGQGAGRVVGTGQERGEGHEGMCIQEAIRWPDGTCEEVLAVFRCDVVQAYGYGYAWRKRYRPRGGGTDNSWAIMPRPRHFSALFIYPASTSQQRTCRARHVTPDSRLLLLFHVARLLIESGLSAGL
jgi:hypothetical protein